jgi:hypothetical protein
MPLDPTESAVSAVAQATTEIVKQVTQKDAEKNTPAVQAAKAAADLQAADDRITKDVAEKKLAEIQKDDAE